MEEEVRFLTGGGKNSHRLAGCLPHSQPGIYYGAWHVSKCLRLLITAKLMSQAVGRSGALFLLLPAGWLAAAGRAGVGFFGAHSYLQEEP